MNSRIAHLFYSASFAFGICMTCACSDTSSSNDIAGGVTDIGNSVAAAKITGTVTDENGDAIANARVVAYYDNWDQTQATDSVEVSTDKNGNFSLEVDSTEDLVLYAENGDECGLAFAGDQNMLVLGNRKSLESTVLGETDGYMRIVGTNETAKVNKDGSFSFDAVPPGDISLVYVRDEKPQGYLEFKTTDKRNKISLPPLERRKEDGQFNTQYFESNTYGVDFGYNRNYYDASFLNVALYMEGYEPVFNSDHSWAKDSNLVEGILGSARVLKPGQYIALDKQKALGKNFTIALWTKWNGANDNKQVLFSEKVNGDSVSQIKWYFDSEKNSFVVQAETIQGEKTINFDAPNFTTENWTFLTLVSDDSKINLYINGEMVKTGKEASLSLELNSVKDVVSYYIGGTGNENSTWNGALDEYHIEGYVLNANWIKDVYEMTVKSYKSRPGVKPAKPTHF